MERDVRRETKSGDTMGRALRRPTRILGVKFRRVVIK